MPDVVVVLYPVVSHFISDRVLRYSVVVLVLTRNGVLPMDSSAEDVAPNEEGFDEIGRGPAVVGAKSRALLNGFNHRLAPTQAGYVVIKTKA
ncbi:hypothetical protein PIB30_049793 [Stylosanthes scabra]|uniref:Uncharacterized protein n=1 Tax=Stylosanthes scabra TaxID=79078 RepID=A0ABU6QH00_9FABA|nr:hypothetical protein [Stylosanthes scabra]